ncbi:MAG: hypothetical protein DSZ28_02775 [Thiothrix sp.]|nr:MAG: hypothetical protein DSZ28_02775 [Thiothrix sp.]
MTSIKCYIACLLFIASFSALAAPPTFSLSHNQWRIISLPATPPDSTNTVEKILGDDMAGGIYEQNWIVYAYDTTSNSYGGPLSLSDTMEQGKGYWIIQNFSQDAITLDMPENSTEIPAADSIPLTASKDGSPQWNLAGNPLGTSLVLENLRLTTTAPSCNDGGCGLNKAKDNNLVHNKVWTYDGQRYIKKGVGSVLQPWEGFWVPTLGGSSGYDLLLTASAKGSGSINTLPASPTYTYRIPTTTELVVGGNNELSTINQYVWSSTGVNPVTHASLKEPDGPYYNNEKNALHLKVGSDNSSHMYQKIPTKAGRRYVFKANSYAFRAWTGSTAYFTVESAPPGHIKANVLGESSASNNANQGLTTHAFEFVATGAETYVVARSSAADQRIFIESISVKEKNVTVPFTTISAIKHEGVTLPFDDIKKWRTKTNANTYKNFIAQTSGIPRAIELFKGYNIPDDGILDVDTDIDAHREIIDYWASESKTAVHLAVRGLIEKNHQHMKNSVTAIDVWAKRFKGMVGFGAGTYISWVLKEYANAIEIILHNDIGYTYPSEEKARAKAFLDAMYSVMLKEDGSEMLESGRLGGNWVSSQIMSKLAYWVVKDSLATTSEEKQTALNKFNFYSKLTDSLFVSQIFMNSDPLGLPNTFYDKGLDSENGTIYVDRIYAGNLDLLDGIWYIGTDSNCFQHDGLVEEYYRDIGHAHMGLEPVFNIAQILYLQDGENMYERHKERLIKASEVLQETHLAALGETNQETGLPYSNLPSPECNPNATVTMTEKDREYNVRNERSGAIYSSQIYGYAKQHWSNWKTLMPITHATLETYKQIERWDTGVPAVYLEAFFLWDQE